MKMWISKVIETEEINPRFLVKASFILSLQLRRDRSVLAAGQSKMRGIIMTGRVDCVIYSILFLKST
jgi:hypothetical protein